MRQFIVVGHEVPIDSKISLDDLPGAGRLDLLCRCVTSAFLLSHDIREAVRVQIVVGNYTIRFEGSQLRRLNPDERSTAALIRGALDAREEAIGAMEASPSPGIYVGNRDFESAIETAAGDGTLIELHEEGTPIVDVDPPEKPIFVLSDHRDFTADETEILAEHADERLSMGPHALHANDVISIVHNYLDTDGYRSY